ncbi:unnamed protein product [Tuber aestivum]|uniref:Uncharacterized protein n=1 Tax=Tuber aestivum TaxID=59557 RepID=A0A292PW71_9PEZI|nr:unnamed protein product [Tuber aestivum]
MWTSSFGNFPDREIIDSNGVPVSISAAAVVAPASGTLPYSNSVLYSPAAPCSGEDSPISSTSTSIPSASSHLPLAEALDTYARFTAGHDSAAESRALEEQKARRTTIIMCLTHCLLTSPSAIWVELEISGMEWDSELNAPDTSSEYELASRDLYFEGCGIVRGMT